MEQDGVEAKPLVQITGEGEFNEVFINEARIPDENVVGGVGNGWGVAITTLMNERAGLAFGAIAADPQQPREARRARHRGARGRRLPAAEDAYFRQRIAQLFIEAETMRLNAYRGLTKTMESGIPGPEGSLGKWQWADINQGPDRAGAGDRGRLGAARPRLRAGRRERRLAVQLPPLARQLDRGRHHRHPQEHHRRARARPAADALRRDGLVLRPDRRAASDPLDRPRLPRLALQIGADAGDRRVRDGTDEAGLERDGRARLGRAGAARGVGRPGPRDRRPRGALRGDGLRARSLAALLQHRGRPGARAERLRRAEGALAATARRGEPRAAPRRWWTPARPGRRAPTR